jgi:hypothetical protein
MARMPRVDFNGRDLPPATADPSVTELVTPPTAPPSLAQALSQAAEAVGADLEQLLDSASFCAEIAKISPSDSAGLREAVLDHMPAPAAPTMASNPSQGHVGASAPGQPTGTFLERMQAQAAKALTQPEPPGSTFR